MNKSNTNKSLWKSRSIVAVGGLVLVAATAFSLSPYAAFATPPSGFSRTELSTGLLGAVDAKADKTDKWDLFLKTKDKSTLGLDRLTITPGGNSGWHTHAGITIVTVTDGEITWIDGVACSRRVYRVGESFVEAANRLHLVRNMTASDAVFTAVQLRPEGAGGRLDADAPSGCTF